jgi:hypothetical protein
MDLRPRNLVRDNLYLTAYFLLFRSVTRNRRRDRGLFLSDAYKLHICYPLKGGAGPSVADLSTELRGIFNDRFS